MEQQDAQKYKEAQSGILVDLISEAVNYVAVIVSLVLTFSLAILMDTLVSTCNFLRVSLVFYINKKVQRNLKFSYNYGTDRLEGLVTAFCDALMIIGSVIVIGACIYQVIIPREVSDRILVAVIFKVICVIVDIAILIPIYNAYKKTRTKLSKSAFDGMVASLLLDAGILLGVLLSMILKSWSGVGYVEPAISVIICVFVIISAVRRIKSGVGELTDLTLDEDSQMKILKVVSAHFEEFESLSGINSHRFGEKVYIDLEFAFPADATYTDIKQFLCDVSNEIEAEFPENVIALKITNEN